MKTRSTTCNIVVNIAICKQDILIASSVHDVSCFRYWNVFLVCSVSSRSDEAMLTRIYARGIRSHL